MNGIALLKLLVELKSPQHAIKVQILSSSMKMSFLLLPLNKFYQFQLLLCLCCEKLSFLGDFGVEKAKWGQGNVGRSQNQSCPPQPPFVKYGRCHYWVAMVGMFWIFIELVLKLIQFNIHSKLNWFIPKKYSFSLKEAVSPTPIRGPSYFFTKVTAKLTDLFLLLKSPLVINSIKYRFVKG